MQVALNSKIEAELMQALEEYIKSTDRKKNAVIMAGLLKVIPKDILKKNGVIEDNIIKKYGI